MTRDMRINPNLVDMQYAVRGPIPLRAAALQADGRDVVFCNIGNPQALGQAPLSYYRQVMALLQCPALIHRERTLKQSTDALDPTGQISDHVLDLAENILRQMPTGMGAYTASKGPLFIREAVARFIDERDAPAAVPADPESIFLTNGASEGAKHVLEMFITDSSDGIMIPIPQYPLYSAVITRCGGSAVPYHPHEPAGWTLNRDILETSLANAREKGIETRAIVVINPGNPTGALLSAEDVASVIDFAEEHGLAVVADEVYQENTYGEAFTSFAQVLGRRDVPLFSLHSTSKGFIGECGQRGGYLEVRNPPRVAGQNLTVMDILLKLASVSLCSNTAGQIMTYLMVTPPPTGSEPHELFHQERKAILEELDAKARIIKEAFAQMEGVECFGRFGAMYLFPRLTLPEGVSDFDYCMALLEETGLCTVNGTGFGLPGHLRIAVLPPRDLLADVLPRWVAFHNRFLSKAKTQA